MAQYGVPCFIIPFLSFSNALVRLRQPKFYFYPRCLDSHTFKTEKRCSNVPEIIFEECRNGTILTCKFFGWVLT